MQSFLLHEFPHNLLGDSGADSAEAVPDPSVAVAPIALVEGFDYLFFNLRIFIRSCLSVSLVEIRTLRKFQNFQEILVSSAMTFFQGKRNETFPERFTIVS